MKGSYIWHIDFKSTWRACYSLSSTEGSKSLDGQACWSVLQFSRVAPAWSRGAAVILLISSEEVITARGQDSQSHPAGARREHLQTCRPAVLTLTSMQTCRPYTDLQTSRWPAWHEATYCSALDTSQAFLDIDIGLSHSYRVTERTPSKPLLLMVIL